MHSLPAINKCMFKTFQLKENWKRRCSLSLARQEDKRKQEEEERLEHERNVARRTSIVEQQRRKSRGKNARGEIGENRARGYPYIWAI